MYTIHRHTHLGLLGLLLAPMLAATSLAVEPKPVSEEVIAAARNAVLSVQQSFKETNTSYRYNAAFIDTKGWAVVPLDALTYHSAPTFRDSKGSVIPFKKILAMDPELMLAIVELERRPKTPLRLSRQNPEIGEPFALLWDNGGSRGARSGPILAHRKLSKHGPGAPPFLSLGMYIGDTIRSGVVGGSPVINSRGELVGIYSTTEYAGVG